MYSNFSVSVIIPVYNAQKYIKRAIASVLIQKEVGEVILVEDGSTDDSLHICLRAKKLDERIIVLRHIEGKNKGVSASRNLGIEKATYPLIAFLDADDYYLPNRFNTALECFVADNSTDGVYEPIALHTDPSDIKPFSVLKNVSYKFLFNSLSPIGFDGWFHCNGLTVKKTAFEKSGLFDEELKTSEDTLLWLQLAASCKLVSGSRSRAVAIRESTSGSLSGGKKQVDKDQISMLYKLLSWLNKSTLDKAVEKEELVIDTIIRLHFGVKTSFLNRVRLAATFLGKVVAIDYKFPFKSRGVRRVIGSMIGYNKLLGICYGTSVS